MALHLTTYTTLEKNDSLFRELTILYSPEERARLKVKVSRFVETVLNYNPDATEQIDVRDKHLSCAENLGEKTRGQTLLLFQEQSETFDSLSKSLLKPLPFWLKDIFKELEGLLSQLDPADQKIKINRLHEFSKFVPVLSKQPYSYFKLVEKKRPDCERLVTYFDTALTRLRRFESDLANQMDDIRQLSRSLYHTIEFGYMIEQGLIHALKKDIPKGDPRIAFIEKELTRRFRERIALLRMQMSTNHKSLICQYLYLQNCQELIRGLEQAKRLMIEAFNLAVHCGKSLLGKRTYHRLGESSDSDIDSSCKPAEQFYSLKRIFSELDGTQRSLLAFITEAGPMMKQAFEEKQADEQKTSDLFDKLKKSLENALLRNLAELE